MDLLKNILLMEEPYIHLLSCKQEVFNELVEKYYDINEDNQKIFATVIEGNYCSNVDSLMKEFANKLKFPNYFGGNWSAFDECINDLEWLDSDKYVIFIRDVDKLLTNNEELEVFLKIMYSAIDEWVSGRQYDSFPTLPTPFHLVLHYEQERTQEIWLNISKVNIKRIEKVLM